MASPTDTQLVDWSLKQFGPPFAMAVVFIIGLLREWWALGAELRRERARADKWEALAVQLMATTDKAVTILKRAG